MRQTSISSFYDLQESGEVSGRQKMVLDALIRLGHPATDREICDFLFRTDPNFVRPRRNELYKKGLIKCVGQRTCHVSKKTAMIWEAKQ